MAPVGQWASSPHGPELHAPTRLPTLPNLREAAAQRPRPGGEPSLPRGSLGKGGVRTRGASLERLLPRQVLGEVGGERQNWSLGSGREDGEGKRLFWIRGDSSLRCGLWASRCGRG